MRDRWIDDELWDSIQRHIPVTCVDLVPVRATASGTQVGLIERDSPFGVRWCQLGGRLHLGETLRDGLLRHLAHTLAGVTVELPADPQPDYVMQWFTDPIAPDRGGVAYGHDPRRHAVALCFLAQLHGEPTAVEGGEALRFGWFTLDDVRALGDRAWPGTAAMIESIVMPLAGHDRP